MTETDSNIPNNFHCANLVDLIPIDDFQNETVDFADIGYDRIGNILLDELLYPSPTP